MEERSTAPMGLDLTRPRRGEITSVCGALLVLLGLFVPPVEAPARALARPRPAPIQ